jgi:uroporphyrinogen decarboxylase
MISKRERLEAAIAKEITDQTPVALWRHFPVDDQAPETLANSISLYQAHHDFDFVKVTPASSFCLCDWGVEDEWQGNEEGTRVYTKRVIETPEGWASLRDLDPESGALGDQLHCLKLLRGRLGEDVPIVQTIFNPLSQAKNLAGGDRLFQHLHRHPEALKAGLEIITRSTIAFIDAAVKRGIDGIFYAIQHASYRYFDEAGFQEFSEGFDLQILEAANRLWLNVLHLHGEAIMFTPAETYPVAVVNWHDRESEIDLKQGSARINGAVCGGLRRRTVALGTPEQVEAEARDAVEMMAGGGFILGTGCVAPIITPEANYQAVKSAIDCV